MRIRDGIAAFAAVAMLGTVAFAQTPATITVTSPTLKANEVVPIDHTADGKNVSPALTWSGAPANTKQFALIYDDPDVAFGNPPQSFVHWVVYNIPATAKGLPAELPMDAVLTAPAEIAGTIQGMSGFRRTGYRGPAPPPGKPHHYTWTVYALDAELKLEQGLNRNQLMEAMKENIIGQGSLVAIYERKPKQ
ncbi:MAG TPA: YbhB/YbcL family Raf kinase inhibitor-like protein [Vicinamibacterales bacterium]|nr:YbhB/YbcL family Raf kinase inhibitor-like protein [Vicinamibacterales bacterium]